MSVLFDVSTFIYAMQILFLLNCLHSSLKIYFL